MDRHGHAKSDVKRVKDDHPPQPVLLGKEREHRERHGKGDGGVRGRPAPEHPAAQDAELERMADVHAARFMEVRVNPAREGLVSGGDERAEQFRLPDGPPDAGDPEVQRDIAGEDECQRQDNRYEPADGCGRDHPLIQQRAAGGGKIKPIKTGRDQDDCEQDGGEVPEHHPPAETADDIAGQGEEEVLHVWRRQVKPLGDPLKSVDFLGRLRAILILKIRHPGFCLVNPPKVFQSLL